MLFSSMTFIYMFLPILSIFYILVKKKFQDYVLLIFSIIFYAWNNIEYLLMLFFLIIVSYFSAILIDKYKKYKKIFITISIITTLFFLFYYKYFNFFITNINSVFSTNFALKKVIMPIGISFYTFKIISYLVDVYKEQVKPEKDICKLALYVCMFQELLAGPISQYHDIEEQIKGREIKFEQVIYGTKRFIIGLAKKMIIANTVYVLTNKIFSQEVYQISPLIGWLGAISFVVYVYYDFSGYSDIAVGLGAMFGFTFPENFDYPYISKTITEFWRRWHISLGSWFKTYLYFPLGGSRCSKYRNYFNIMIVYIATGFWHGANWTYIIWGIWNGIFNIIERDTGIYKKDEKYNHIILHYVWTFCVMIVGHTIFISRDIKYAFNYLRNMLGLYNHHQLLYKNLYYFDRIDIFALVVGIICCFPIFKNILNVKNKYLKILINIWLLFLLILSTSAIASQTYNAFVYFQF